MDQQQQQQQQDIQSLLKLSPSADIAILYRDTLDDCQSISYKEFIATSNLLRKELLNILNKKNTSNNNNNNYLYYTVEVSCEPTPHLPILVYSIIQTPYLVLKPVSCHDYQPCNVVDNNKNNSSRFLIITEHEFQIMDAGENRHDTMKERDKARVERTNVKRLDSLPGYVVLLSPHYYEHNNDNDNAKEKEDFLSIPSPVYVIQSSGTTGHPKNIHVTQDCIVPNILDLRNTFHLKSSDTIMLTSAITFDAALLLMFLSWVSRSTLLVVAKGVFYNSTSLAHCLKEVTILQCTPSLLQMVGSKLLTSQVFTPHSKLRVLALGGEAFPRKIKFEKWLQRAPSTLRVFNIYGITEVSAWASIYEIDIANAPSSPAAANSKIFPPDDGGWCDWVPVGRPLSKTCLEVWNMAESNEEEVDRGNLGRLVIGTTKRLCVIEDNSRNRRSTLSFLTKNQRVGRRSETSSSACKYVLTGDLAVQNAEGSIFVCGRVDNRIKRFGKFVSLSRLSDVVECVPSVQRCLSRYCNDSNVLFCFIQTSASHTSLGNVEIVNNSVETLTQSIYKHVRAHLPPAYFPDVIRFFDVIPITLNGKPDFEKLLAAAKRQRPTSSTKIESYQPRVKLSSELLSSGKVSHPPKEQLISNRLSVKEDNDCQLTGRKANSESGRLTSSFLRECWCMALDIVATPSSESSGDQNLSLGKTFVQLGGDSFSALALLNRLADVEPRLRTNDVRRGGELYETLFTELLVSSYEQFVSFLWLQLKMSESSAMEIPSSTTTTPSTTTTTTLQVATCIDLLTPELTTMAIPTTPNQTDTRVTPAIPATTTTRSSIAPTVLYEVTQKKSVQNTSGGPYLTSSVDDNLNTMNSHKDLRHLNGDVQYYTLFQARNKFHERLPMEQKFKQQQQQQQQQQQINCDLSIESCSSSTDFIRHVKEVFEFRSDSPDSVTLTVTSKFNLGKCIDASPLVLFNQSNCDGLVLIGSHSRAFVALSSPWASMGVLGGERMREQWRVTTDDRIESSAALTEDGQYCVFGCYNSYIYFVDIKTGYPYWKFKTDDIVKSSPTCIKYYVNNVVSNPQYRRHVTISYSLNIDDTSPRLQENDNDNQKRGRDDDPTLKEKDFQHQDNDFQHQDNDFQHQDNDFQHQDNDFQHQDNDFQHFDNDQTSPLQITFIACHDKYLYALNHTTKTLLWKHHTNGLCSSAPLATTAATCDASKLVYVALLTGKLLALDQLTGRLEWQFTASKPVFTSPGFFGRRRIVFGCVDGGLYCVEAARGTLLWKIETGGPIFSSPTVTNYHDYSKFKADRHEKDCYSADEKTTSKGRKKQLYCCFGSNDGFLYTLDEHGSLVWKARIGMSVVSSPAILNPTISRFPLKRNHSESDNGVTLRRVPSTTLMRKLLPIVFCIDTKGGFHMFRLDTGKRITVCGVTRSGGEVFSSPVVIGNRIVFGSRDDHVYFLEAS